MYSSRRRRLCIRQVRTKIPKKKTIQSAVFLPFSGGKMPAGDGGDDAVRRVCVAEGSTKITKGEMEGKYSSVVLRSILYLHDCVDSKIDVERNALYLRLLMEKNGVEILVESNS